MGRAGGGDGMMRRMAVLFCAFGCAIVAGPASPTAARAQILNTLAGFQEREPGWSGSGSFRVSLEGGNTDKRVWGGALRLQWQNDSERLRLLAGGTRETVHGQRVDEETNLHLRHNHRLNARLRTLVFAQAQHDLFQRLRRRILAGAGGRVDVVRRDPWDLATGAAHMLEWERLEGGEFGSADHRLSAFVFLQGRPDKRMRVDLTAFYQPLWSDFDDARAVANAAIRLTVLGPIAVFTAGEVKHDSRPAEEVETTDWALQTGVEIAL